MVVVPETGEVCLERSQQEFSFSAGPLTSFHTGACVILRTWDRVQSTHHFPILFSGAEALNWEAIMRPEMQPGEQNVDPLPDELPVVDEMLQPSSSIKERRRLNIRRVAIGLLLVGFVVFVIIDSSTTGYIRSGINNLLDWIKEHPIQGWFVFCLLCGNYSFHTRTDIDVGCGVHLWECIPSRPRVVLGTMSVFLEPVLGQQFPSFWVVTSSATGLLD
ncbi:SNARE associated Golgi protein [Fragilaria crotonensis]|nr:SNARE associated Golgi protein [Fragilaria crotonensis]